MDLTRSHLISGLCLLALAGGAGAYCMLGAPDPGREAGARFTAERDLSDVRPQRDERGNDADRTLARQVEVLTAEVEALRGLVAQQRAAEQPGAAGDDALPSEDEQQAIWEEYVSYAEAGFNDEPTDTRWATATGSLIQQQIAGWPALRGATQSLECRSKSCRLELRDDGSQAFAGELPRLVHRLGSQLSSVVVDLVQDEQGRRTQVLYMSRAETPKGGGDGERSL